MTAGSACAGAALHFPSPPARMRGVGGREGGRQRAGRGHRHPAANRRSGAAASWKRSPAGRQAAAISGGYRGPPGGPGLSAPPTAAGAERSRSARPAAERAGRKHLAAEECGADPAGDVLGERGVPAPAPGGERRRSAPGSDPRPGRRREVPGRGASVTPLRAPGRETGVRDAPGNEEAPTPHR